MRSTVAPCTQHCCESPTPSASCKCEKCVGKNHGLWLRENARRWQEQQRGSPGRDNRS